MAEVFPGIILGFREGMEAFLIIGIMIDYLKKIERKELVRPVRIGLAAGIAGSFLLALLMLYLTKLAGGNSETVSKLWESGASLLALLLLTTFIYWMMKHGRTVVADTRKDVSKHLSAGGLFGVAFVVVLREGVEIVLFSLSSVDKGVYSLGIGAGVILAAVLAFLVSRSLIRLNLSLIFNITLAYLVLQAGYLFGYAIHELLSSLKVMGTISPDHWLLVKAYDLKDSFMDHKSGALGVPLNILIGWYSRPEWIQLILQLTYVGSLFLIWKKVLRKFAEQNKK